MESFRRHLQYPLPPTSSRSSNDSRTRRPPYEAPDSTATMRFCSMLTVDARTHAGRAAWRPRTRRLAQSNPQKPTTWSVTTPPKLPKPAACNLRAVRATRSLPTGSSPPGFLLQHLFFGAKAWSVSVVPVLGPPSDSARYVEIGRRPKSSQPMATSPKSIGGAQTRPASHSLETVDTVRTTLFHPYRLGTSLVTSFWPNPHPTSSIRAAEHSFWRSGRADRAIGFEARGAESALPDPRRSPLFTRLGKTPYRFYYDMPSGAAVPASVR
jgi:hypothetical protein